jgi:hypothetical protein
MQFKGQERKRREKAREQDKANAIVETKQRRCARRVGEVLLGQLNISKDGAKETQLESFARMYRNGGRSSV